MLVDRRADRLLEAAIGALAYPDGRGRTVSSIPVRAADGNPPTIIHIVPIKGAAHDVFSPASALMIVTQVVPKDVPSAEVVQGLFDLTPAEARIARAIGKGDAPADIRL